MCHGVPAPFVDPRAQVGVIVIVDGLTRFGIDLAVQAGCVGACSLEGITGAWRSFQVEVGHKVWHGSILGLALRPLALPNGHNSVL